MLFTFKDFEQHFKESVLKRGMKLFENNKVETLKFATPDTQHFLVDGLDLKVKRKGDKILSCVCACNSKSYCEHLAALLFYFHSDKLWESSPRHPGSGMKTRQRGSAKTQAALIKGRQVWNGSLEELKTILKPYLLNGTLEQKQVDEIVKELKNFRKAAANSPRAFYRALAILSEFSSLLNLRLKGNEVELHELYEACARSLELANRNSLDPAQKEAWLKALISSVKNNRRLISGAYSFLLSRYLSDTTVSDDVRKIYQLLVRRKLQVGNRLPIDPLKIAVLQTELKLATLFTSSVALSPDKRGAEFTIAKAELFFARGKNDQAFRVLEKERNRIENNYPDQYADYLQFLLMQSKNKGRKDLELRYLLKSIVQGYFVSDSQLNQLTLIVPAQQREKILKELIRDVRSNRKTFSFDKLSKLLVYDKRTDELIHEIKRHKNKFNLLHDLLMKKLPDYSRDLLSLYALQVGDAILEGRYFKLQQGVIDKMKEYAIRLPVVEAGFLIDRILDLSGHQAQISKYVQMVMGKEFNNSTE